MFGNKFWIVFNSLLLLFFGIGCAVGPDYREPKLSVPESWVNSSDRNAVTSENPSELSKWWTNFEDPELTSLIERGLKANLDLKLAVERVRQARAERSQAFSALLPSLNANFQASRSKSSSGSNSLNESSGSQISNFFQEGFDAAWELDIFGKNRRALEASSELLKSSQSQQGNVLISTAAEIALHYINLRAIQKQLSVAKENLVAQEHAASIASKLLRAGFTSSLDFANAQTLVSITKAQIPQFESALDAEKYTLAVLLGTNPDALLPELQETKPMPLANMKILPEIPALLLKRRPDIVVAEEQLHAATAEVGVAVAELFPSFSLSGSLGFSSNHWAGLQNWHHEIWQSVGSVTMPIFEGGKLRANLEIQKSLQAQALYQYEKTVLSAFQEVETVLSQLNRERSRQDDLLSAVATSKNAYDIASKLYVDGLSEFINVLDAERSLLSSQQSLISSQQTILINMVALYKALGGGWDRDIEN